MLVSNSLVAITVTWLGFVDMRTFAQRIDPITELISEQERLTLRVPIDKIPATLQALGPQFYENTVFDGDWYSPDSSRL